MVFSYLLLSQLMSSGLIIKHMTRKIKDQNISLQILYLIIIFILFCFIIYTPTLINGPTRITEKLILQEETIEGSLLGILFLLSILILNLYKREVFKHKELAELTNKAKIEVVNKLRTSDQYIGRLNVQITEIKSIFNSISKYPDTKAELKETYRFFGKRILGIVNSNWVLIRIINSNTQRTISEHFEIRQGFSFEYPHVSNKMIIENQNFPSYTSVISNPENLKILAFCIMPVDQISNDQSVFIQAIINEITKMFVILKSTYYKSEKIELV